MLVNNIALFIKNVFKPRSLYLLCFFCINLNSLANTFYVSTTGNDNNQGTLNNPWSTWSKAFETAKPGDTIFFRGGVYSYPLPSGNIGPVNSGTSSAWIHFLNFPGEVPILDCSNKTRTTYSYALYLNSKSYILFRGLHFRNNKQLLRDHIAGGTNLYNCDYVTFENCKSYNHGYTGFSDGSSNNILYYNCDSYGNYNSNMSTYSGGGSDGYYTTSSGGSGTIRYIKCRAWNNSDDGWDSMYNDGLVVWEGCWSMSNGYDLGDGTGYKLGHINSCDGKLQRVLKNCISINNKWSAYNENNRSRPSSHIECYNNVSYNDLYGFMNLNSSDDMNQRIYRNNISFRHQSASTYLFNEPNVIDDHNTWNLEYIVSAVDFVSLDTTSLYASRNPDGSLPVTDFMKLKEGSGLIDAGINVGLPYYGSAPDLGWYESSYEENTQPPPAVPVIVSAAIENATPARLELNYNLTLANIIPSVSAFSVRVNNETRTVTSVAVSGTKVLLTLASPVAYGNSVTVAYTKPASNPIQTTAGGQADSFSARTVTNNVAAPTPAFVSAVIENVTPARLELNYNLTLANIIPSVSAFSVRVNNETRTVTSVAVSGTKVLLTLASPVAYGNSVTVAYTKPASNPIQTTAGGQADSFSARTVTNNVAAPTPAFVSAVIENVTPARLELNYNLTLANIIPSVSAFSVRVNNETRTVTSVAVSGTKVLLTLASPVVFGNSVTVAYTKPASNPIQTTAGGQADSFSAQTVTNNVGNANQPPVISISSPTKSNSYIAPATITIETTVSDPDNNLSRVEFYQGTLKIGELSASPYTFVWKDVAEGTYSLTAIAIDQLNLRTTSLAVSVTVEKSASATNQLPNVSISVTNRKKPRKHDNVTILAEATDPDGNINKVVLKNGDVVIEEKYSAPFIFIMSDVDTGRYDIQVIAFDNLGASNTASLQLIIDDLFDYNTDYISIYPNPNSGSFNVDLDPSLSVEERTLSIVSLSGQQISKVKISGDTNTLPLSMPDIPSGTYVVILSKDKEILSTRKFIKF